MTTLAAIQQPQALAKIAYDALRDSILAGRLRPSKVYSEKVLAAELGISKTPVREALLELSVQGLVQFLPRRGVQVTHFSKKDAQEVFEVRRAIEANIVEKLAAASAPPDLRKAEKTIVALRKAIDADDMKAFLDADRKFHDEVASLADNSRLLAILGNVRDLIHVMAWEALTKTGRPLEVVSEHETVVEAIKQGKPVEAREAMNLHLKLSENSVMEQYNEGHGSQLTDAESPNNKSITEDDSSASKE
jgi:DNA-binding GntR family transcriptional regulator